MLLLHLFAFLIPERLTVISIDHQLQDQSQYWSALVLKTCQLLNIPCQVIAVDVGSGNVEAAARQARYHAFEKNLKPDDVLILAHHQQDQAETVMLRLLQGSGVGGLSAMQEIEKRRFIAKQNVSQSYFLWRPMLDLNKNQISTWALQDQLHFVDDPMNQDQHYDRVWCRQQLWSVLEQRFPKMQDAIARSASLLHDADEILKEVLAQDWSECVDQQQRLNLNIFQQKSVARQRQLLSIWMQGDNLYRPALAMVERLKQEVIYAKVDAQSQLHCAGYYFVRFAGYLYRYTVQEWQAFVQPTVVQEIQISLTGEFKIALGHINLKRTDAEKIGLSVQLLDQKLQLIPRQGGEKLHIVGRVGTRPLKKLLQDAKIAPWYRHQIQILMYHNDVLGVFTPQGFWLVDNPLCEQGGWLPHMY